MFKNNKIFILIAIVAVAIGGGVYFLNKNENVESPALTKVSEVGLPKIESLTSDKPLPTEDEDMDKWIEMGIQRKSAGDFLGAAEAWKQASLANPGSYLPHNNLGFLYRYDIKDFAKAEKSFLDAVAIRPDLTIAYRELSDLYRYAYTEKADQADDILLKGLEKNPGHYDILIYLAHYYRDMGDKEKAKKYFEEILKTDPTNEAVIRELNKL